MNLSILFDLLLDFAPFLACTLAACRIFRLISAKGLSTNHNGSRIQLGRFDGEVICAIEDDTLFGEKAWAMRVRTPREGSRCHFSIRMLAQSLN
jgi:hypothetical protein